MNQHQAERVVEVLEDFIVAVARANNEPCVEHQLDMINAREALQAALTTHVVITGELNDLHRL